MAKKIDFKAVATEAIQRSEEELKGNLERATVTPIDPLFRDVPDGYNDMLVDEIDLYDKNIRLQENPEYENLKIQILANGFIGALEVTRRPGETRYFVRAGGNTRLSILKELWKSGDARFKRVKCTTRPYALESELVALHIAENTSRGELVFWETAQAFDSLRTELGKEKGSELSQREFESALKKVGLYSSQTSIARYSFAARHFSKLGTHLQLQLSRSNIEDLMQAKSKWEALLKRCNKLNHLTDILVAADKECENYGNYAAMRGDELNLEELISCWHAAIHAVLGYPMIGIARAIECISNTEVEFSDAIIEAAINDNSPRVVKDAKKKRNVQLAAIGQAAAPTPSAITIVPPAVLTLEAPTGKSNTWNGDSLSLVATPSVTPVGMTIATIRTLAQRFAEASSLGHCLVMHDAVPLGFYIEIPDAELNQSAQMALHPEHPQYQYLPSLILMSWYLLATASLQTRQHVAAMLPKTSAYRLAMHDGDYGEHMSLFIDRVGNEMRASEFVTTLLFTDCTYMPVGLQLLGACAEFRQQNPELFDFSFMTLPMP